MDEVLKRKTVVYTPKVTDDRVVILGKCKIVWTEPVITCPYIPECFKKEKDESVSGR